MNGNVKEQLLKEIEITPNSTLQEVLDFCHSFELRKYNKSS
jgi:hypothetical protein